MHLFSEQVLGTHAFRLRDQWIVLGTIAFRFVIGTIRGLRSLTSMHYTAQPETLVRMIDRLTLGHVPRLPQLCAKPLPVEHVLGTIAFRLRFGGVLRGRFVPRTWFDRVLAGTRLFRTRSDYKKWCVPRTCSRWNCTENKCERPDNMHSLQISHINTEPWSSMTELWMRYLITHPHNACTLDMNPMDVSQINIREWPTSSHTYLTTEPKTNNL